jgi:hypothetical protein
MRDRAQVVLRPFSVIGLAILLLAGCGAGQVVLPPDSAAPAVVLDAYLTAIQAGNCDGARALATSDFGDGTRAYCDGMRVTGFDVFSDPSQISEREVEFALSLATAGGDETLPDGSHTWFFSLTREAGGAWRVHGGGSGP